MIELIHEVRKYLTTKGSSQMNYNDYYNEVYTDIYLEFGADSVSDPDYAEQLLKKGNK